LLRRIFVRKIGPLSLHPRSEQFKIGNFENETLKLKFYTNTLIIYLYAYFRLFVFTIAYSNYRFETIYSYCTFYTTVEFFLFLQQHGVVPINELDSNRSFLI
ncbi:hypothetical protein T4E_2784, partial [Trichinella pseudospiralis]